MKCFKFGPVAGFFSVFLLFSQWAYAVTIEEVTSDKGITAWLIKDEKLPVLAIDFAFKDAGALADPLGKEGLGKFVASTIDEGAADWDSQTFQGLLDQNSITLSFDIGTDDFEGTFYSLNRYAELGTDMLRAALLSPRFDDEPVERIRRQLTSSAKRQFSRPSSIGNMYLWQSLYPDHPYHGPIRGSEESLASISKDDLKTRWQNSLAKSNLVVSVVGDIEVDELKILLDKVFGDLPETAKLPDMQEPDADYFGKFEWIDYDAAQTSGIFVQPGVDRKDPDFYPVYIANYILGGGGFASRLTTEIREKRGLVYSVYSYLIGMEQDNLMFGGFATSNATAGETVDILRAEWKKASEGSFTQEELTAAQTYLTGSFGLRFTNSSRIAQYLTGIQRHELGIDFINTRNSVIEAVTLDQVNEAARKFIKPESLSILMVGKPEGVEGARLQEFEY